MRCPHCSDLDSKVVESRDATGSIRRRRKCLSCGFRFTTYERIEPAHLMVVKKDGTRESFDRQKLATGFYRAFQKRPYPAEKINDLIDQVTEQIRAEGEAELSSEHIGEVVMAALLKTDDVAYVRFASVYRSFTDISGFEKELVRLRDLQNDPPKR